MQNGRGEVAWQPLPRGDAGVELLWREFDGPPVEPPRKRGFGSRPIEPSAQDLRGSLEFDFAASGLTCRLAFSLCAPPEDPPSAEAA